MVRRAKRAESREAPPILHVYEGPEALSALLERAGSALGARQVAERFRAAQGSGQRRSDAIPALFEEEPRFGSPDEARRLYGNLFALWDRVASGLSLEDGAPPVELPPGAEPRDAAARTVPPVPPLPPRGEATGDELSPEIVEAVWKHLAALPERERRRLRDRFEGAQPDLAAWLDSATLPEAGALAAQDLAFEVWAMFDVAFGDRLGAVPYRELRAREVEPPPLEAAQPALAAYVAEALDLAQEEDASLGAEGRAQVERAVAAVAAGLAAELAPDEA